MASRTSAALSTVFVRIIVSPRVTTQWEVRASWSSSDPMLSSAAARRQWKKTHNCDYAVEITSIDQLLQWARDGHKWSQIAYTELTMLKSIYHYLRLLG